MHNLYKHKAIRTVLYLAVFLYLLTSSCLFNQPSAYGVQETDSDYQVRCEWNYAAKRWRYEVDIPKAIYEYFTNQPRGGDYSVYAYNELDDDWLGYTANSFLEIAERENWDDVDIINFVMSFVQILPYAEDPTISGVLTEYPRYPIETMIDGGGGVDCEDTVVLLVTILSEMGYDVALLLYAADEHMAAGVGISQSLVDAWDGEYPLTYLQSEDDVLYAYCETTGEGHRLGQKPDDITGSAEVLPITSTPEESAE
ncbi:hypothetical protein ACFLXN_02120 [Chloroflexota bacterium]